LAEKKGLNYNFIIAGDGVAREALAKQMPKAFFLGFLGHAKLAHLYASSDVFFFPSVTETFGNVVLEAMASGVPCVIADSGGSKDFIRHGENGFLCDPTDAQDFLHRISEIIEQPTLAEKFSEEGIKTTKKYVWENLAGEYFEDLKSLALKTSVI
jgi:glycosyltransferase involved in cell wall biosynthesis